MRYPVISLWQPWASWVAEGWKTIETRTHPRFKSLVGKTILIHAAQRLDVSGIAAEAEYEFLNEQQRIQTRTLKMQRGLILCSAFVTAHDRCIERDESKALIECGTERYGLFLSDIRKLDKPIHAKGGQGIWYFEFSHQSNQ